MGKVESVEEINGKGRTTFVKKIIKLKLFSICFYFILSLPYIYLIILWDGIFPNTLTSARNLGDKLYLDHIGYTSTIIAFYFVPFLLFKGKDLSTEIKNFFLKKVVLELMVVSRQSSCVLGSLPVQNSEEDNCKRMDTRSRQ